MDVKQLLHAAAKGDKRAWGRIAEYLGPKLRRRFALRYGCLDAEDLLQDTYIVIWRKLGDFEFRSEAEFMSWTHNIARFVALAALRQRTRRQARALRAKGQLEMRTPSSRQSTMYDRQERLEQVMREVDKLPKSQKLAVEYMLECRSTRELAEFLELSWGGARAVESRALKRLRERLRPSTTPS